jgi:hypothetical protein
VNCTYVACINSLFHSSEHIEDDLRQQVFLLLRYCPASSAFRSCREDSAAIPAASRGDSGMTADVSALCATSTAASADISRSNSVLTRAQASCACLLLGLLGSQSNTAVNEAFPANK